jgi:hypothetical protein
MAPARNQSNEPDYSIRSMSSDRIKMDQNGVGDKRESFVTDPLFGPNHWSATASRVFRAAVAQRLAAA